MKKARKLSALLLALVMVFGLSVSAFAAEADQVTIRVYLDGKEQQIPSRIEPVNISAGDTVESAVDEEYRV